LVRHISFRVGRLRVDTGPLTARDADEVLGEVISPIGGADDSLEERKERPERAEGVATTENAEGAEKAERVERSENGEKVGASSRVKGELVLDVAAKAVKRAKEAKAARKKASKAVPAPAASHRLPWEKSWYGDSDGKRA